MTNTDNILKFTSSRFGEIALPEEKIIKVPDGIIGFRSLKRYALLDPSGGQSLFLWLQSVDEPDLAFIITDPLIFVPEYQIETTEPDIQRIGAVEKPSPALFSIVTIPQDNPDRVTINLMAPLLYFENDSTLHQVVLEKSDWPLRFPLIPSKEPASSTAEPSEQLPASGDNGEAD